MTHAIRRLTREKHRLVNIRRDSAPSEVSREGAMTHEHDVIRVRLLFTARPATFDVAAVIVHRDDRTLVQRPENYFFIPFTHRCYRTSIRHQSVKSVVRGSYENKHHF